MSDITSFSIQSGMLVSIELLDRSGEVEPMQVQIVPTELADLKNNRLGEGTPLGQALLGHCAGETVPYHREELVAVRIISVEPVDGPVDRSVLARREETLRKAVHQSELTNAIILSTTFSSKWGDYDPASLVDDLTNDSSTNTEPGSSS